ncbi:hypothetical protein OKW45_007548 [Paraburkholderia sp. WSM4175]|uniref:hypothetical protein n=1 Tax=Paraburkholderia sp. WSM4175 TaxID=2991072 RepID=UPI003D23F2F7
MAFIVAPYWSFEELQTGGTAAHADRAKLDIRPASGRRRKFIKKINLCSERIEWRQHFQIPIGHR